MERLIMFLIINPQVPEWLQKLALVVVAVLMTALSLVLVVLFIDLVFDLGILVK